MESRNGYFKSRSAEVSARVRGEEDGGCAARCAERLCLSERQLDNFGGATPLVRAEPNKNQHLLEGRRPSAHQAESRKPHHSLSHSARVITLTGGNCFALKAAFNPVNSFANQASKSLTTSANSRVIASVRASCASVGLPS